jgi:DNA-binding CsgD family transcriptional regulator
MLASRIGPALLGAPSAAHVASAASAPADQLLREALDRLDQGLMVLVQQCRLAYANRAARDVLARSQVLRLRSDVVDAVDPFDARSFAVAVGAATTRGMQQLLVLNAAPGPTTTPTLAVMPCTSVWSGGERGALVVMGRPALSELTLQWFAQSRGLTPAEGIVLKKLCAGHEPSAIASELRVAVSTVRSQLAAIRQKTGAPCLRALVQQVFSLPPVGCLVGTRAA